MRDCFEILGIAATEDVKSIKRAYARKTKEFHPEEHPDEFREIHQAYEEALKYAEYQNARAAVQEQAVTDETAPKDEEKLMSAEQMTESETGFEADAYETVTEAEETYESTVYGQIEEATAENGKQKQVIREIMNHCRQYYMDEQERNRLYHWKDIFENADWKEVFPTCEFVQEWYGFLKSHHTFSQQVWQYFSSLEGNLFDGWDYEFGRFPYWDYLLEETKSEKSVQQKREEYSRYLKLQEQAYKEKKPLSRAWKMILWTICILIIMIRILLGVR